MKIWVILRRNAPWHFFRKIDISKVLNFWSLIFTFFLHLWLTITLEKINFFSKWKFPLIFRDENYHIHLYYFKFYVVNYLFRYLTNATFSIFPSAISVYDWSNARIQGFSNIIIFESLPILDNWCESKQILMFKK